MAYKYNINMNMLRVFKYYSRYKKNEDRIKKYKNNIDILCQ